jgi:predicted aspartyl protease
MRRPHLRSAPGWSIECDMPLPVWGLLVLGSLMALASHANETADPPPAVAEPTPVIADPARAIADPPGAIADPSGLPEAGAPEAEVLVSAPEPRYVAPTLRDRIGRVWAPVYINGHGPFRLVLDTGATGSAVIQSVATRIGVPVQTNALKLIGATGSSIVPAVQVNSIEVGDLWLDNRKVAIVPDVFGGAEGVLGADGLSDKRIVIDFRNDEISIRRSRGGSPGFGFSRVPVKIRHGHLLMFDVQLAGVKTRAMLDTGAQATVGNTRLREALKRRARNAIPGSVIIGVTLDEQQVESIVSPPVTIADVTIRGMRVTFGDLHIFDAFGMTEQPALLIGMDIIGLLETLVIDYKRKELHLLAKR